MLWCHGFLEEPPDATWIWGWEAALLPGLPSPHRTSFSGHVDHGGLSHESCHGKGAWIRISSDCISKSGESLLEVFAIRKMPACVVTEVLIQRKTLILKVKIMVSSKPSHSWKKKWFPVSCQCLFNYPTKTAKDEEGPANCWTIMNPSAKCRVARRDAKRQDRNVKGNQWSLDETGELPWVGGTKYFTKYLY